LITTMCRGAAVACDAPEYCPGTGASCPADVCRAYGTAGFCAADAYACTNDICNGTCGCTYPVAAGQCLIASVCYASGALDPTNPCRSCRPATSQTAWTNVANGTVCVTDAIACTNQTCQAGVCTVTSTTPPANNTCAGATELTTSGSLATRIWTGSGDTYCATDNYSSTCGGAGWPDTVHFFDVPPDEFATYYYRVEVAGPAAFNPVQYYYRGSAGCGDAGSYYSCNDTGAAACWTWLEGSLAYDADDSCQELLSFPSGRNYIAVDSVGAGGTYQVRVDRRGSNTGDCADPPLPEIQVGDGGTWVGNTCSSTTYWGTNMPYCVQSVRPTYASRFN
ncbi:MAG: hypothetical protein QME96_18875, partial [Myxococcota bacterium]|nr:hypothetical protein [Myxococcota bacterium]